MSDPDQPPVDPSPDAWKIRHRIIIGTMAGLGALMACSATEMFILRSEAIARDFVAIGLPSAVAIAMGYSGIKAWENFKVQR